MYITQDQQVMLATEYIKVAKIQKETKTQIDDIKSQFTSVLKQVKADKLEITTRIGTLLVTEIKPNELVGFDLERFSADYPELAEKYSKKITRAGYLKLTVQK